VRGWADQGRGGEGWSPRGRLEGACVLTVADSLMPSSLSLSAPFILHPQEVSRSLGQSFPGRRKLEGSGF
jgi:hypothetical protein